MRVLVLNPGSSTLKASVVSDASREGDELVVDWPAGQKGADDVVRSTLSGIGAVDAVGYRVVHGGERRGAAVVGEELIRDVEELDVLAPLHNRRAAAVIRAARAALPDLPHVACFDTAFHASLPEEAWRYPLPADWVERWTIRRFGFHGLSVAWACRRGPELLGRAPEDVRLVVAHLGSGCSVTATDGGRSVDTSMGYTPYEGLVMGTRSGSIDPGIILRLAGEGVPVSEIAEGLARESGLKALAGTADAREIETRAAGRDAAAQLAMAIFCRRAAAGIAAAATALGTLDALVFTGGIGANSVPVRSEILRRLATLGLPATGAAGVGDFVATVGPPAVLVIRAREDLVIAAEVAGLLS